MFTGSLTALITPFKNNAVDEAALQDLVQWQLDEGTDGLVPCGTTGESPTLSADEQRRVIELTVEAAAGRAPVIAGAGSNDTSKGIALSRQAEAAGADGLLIVTPYYNKPNQEGLYRHFEAIHDAVSLPILIYNIPGRSVIDMSVKTMSALSRLERIVGVKDATGDMARARDQREACGEDFTSLSGDDSTAVEFAANGGDGAISVTSNVAPGLCAQIWDAAAAGELAEARSIDSGLAELHKALFLDPSPGPAKYALSLLGRSGVDVRLPITEPGEAAKDAVRAAMSRAGLLDG